MRYKNKNSLGSIETTNNFANAVNELMAMALEQLKYGFWDGGDDIDEFNITTDVIDLVMLMVADPTEITKNEIGQWLDRTCYLNGGMGMGLVDEDTLTAIFDTIQELTNVNIRLLAKQWNTFQEREREEREQGFTPYSEWLKKQGFQLD